MVEGASYPILAEESRQEAVIQRSRFITTLAPAASVDAAREFVARIHAEFPDATHHCHAYVVGPPGCLAQVGMSDAGEPRGTAGRPMLDVLLHSGVGDVAGVVTRTFGGVKLGKGGLARAYAGCVKDALAGARLARKVAWAHLRLEVDYGEGGLLGATCLQWGAPGDRHRVVDERALRRRTSDPLRPRVMGRRSRGRRPSVGRGSGGSGIEPRERAGQTARGGLLSLQERRPLPATRRSHARKPGNEVAVTLRSRVRCSVNAPQDVGRALECRRRSPACLRLPDSGGRSRQRRMCVAGPCRERSDRRRFRAT